MTYQHNTLQDCLTECARIETARANCISAMNAVGIEVPADASLGILPQYFKYAGQQESHIPITPSTPISFDNANTAIDNVEIDKRNLKAAINNFCKPTGRQITDDSIDEYYTYIQAVSNISDLNVEYIENLNSDASTYILHRFCVSPDYQNKGIGKEVLAHIETQVHEMGYESMRLDVFSENPYAQKLYRKSGYQVRGYADWRKGRFDLMEKKM